MNSIKQVLFLGLDEPKCSRIAKEMRFVDVALSRCWWGLVEVKRKEFKGDKVRE